VKRLLLILLLLPLSGMPAHAQGVERILALSPHVCEILYAIGAGDEVVGGVDYCDYPSAAKRLPRVGSYLQVYVEQALRTHPTMAIALQEDLPGMQQLARHGVKIVASYPKSVEGMIVDVRRLGRLTGHQAGATRLADSLQQRLDALRSRQQGRAPVPAFYEVWSDPILTCGKPNFITDLLAEAGLHNVFADIDQDTPRVSIESVVRAHPRLILVPDERRAVVREKFWQRWLGSDIRVIAVTPDLLQRPGPRLLAGLEELQQAVRTEPKP